MAFADAGTSATDVQAAGLTFGVTSSGTWRRGDVIGYSGGYVQANASSGIRPMFVALTDSRASGTLDCKVALSAVVSGGRYSGGTAGSALYLSDTSGLVSESVGTVTYPVGLSLADNRVLLNPMLPFTQNGLFPGPQTLTVTPTLSGNLVVSGKITATGNIEAVGDLSVAGNADVGGQMSVNDELVVETLKASAIGASSLGTNLAIGFIPLPLTAWRLIASNDIAASGAADGGTISLDTAPKLIRVNAATDKQLHIQWAAAGVVPITTQFAVPPDMDLNQPVTFKMLANMGGATDTPTVGVVYLENGTGAYSAATSIGGNTAAVTGTSVAVYQRAVTATLQIAAAAIELTPAAHGTDVLNVLATWIEYGRR